MIFDAHLDLAMNALEWNRDLTRPVREIRERECGLTDKPGHGNVGSLGLVLGLTDADHRYPVTHFDPSSTATRFCWRHAPLVA